jgi:hypothetical protein
MDDKRTYTIAATLVVHPGADEHLRDAQAIRDELQSWLESLGATVQSVDVRPDHEGRK